MTQFNDDFPHTGVTHYREGTRQIPAVAVSTAGADLLSGWLRRDPDLRVHLVSACKLQKYFAYHHSANDTFEQVNIRELQLGSAAIASLVYLIDHFGY